ncbi:hypothetical protein [Pseudomonas cichorii]|uniref:hypothetical protein n=1 Tax=Pseudomonas cichorii TaxID=36746 RepID=UPI001F21FC08|nr:hypothetical protein [Pseudomonas cichorii]
MNPQQPLARLLTKKLDLGRAFLWAAEKSAAQQKPEAGAHGEACVVLDRQTGTFAPDLIDPEGLLFVYSLSFSSRFWLGNGRSSMAVMDPSGSATT